jgi:hypothetical protein
MLEGKPDRYDSLFPSLSSSAIFVAGHAADIQQNLFQLWQKLLQPGQAINAPTPQIDRSESFPIWFKGLNIGDELYELIVRHAERAFC